MHLHDKNKPLAIWIIENRDYISFIWKEFPFYGKKYGLVTCIFLASVLSHEIDQI